MPLLSEIESPVLRSFVRIWCEASVDGALPVKTSIDPLDLIPIGIMPIIWLLERRDGEIYCRLAGEDIRAALGKPIGGRKVTDVYDTESGALIIEQWNRILDASESCHNKGVIIASQGRRYEGERIALPVANADGDPRFILGATYYRKLDGLFDAGEMASTLLNEPAVFTPIKDVLSSFAGPA